jgi:hypothetical protein
MRSLLAALVLTLRLTAPALLVLTTACDDDRDTPSPALLGVGETQPDAGSVDPALCVGLDECACAQSADCAPLTTDCYCPPTACGATTTCTCSGGRYLGCNPRGNSCANSHCALFASPSVRDRHGCMACSDPTDCLTAVAQLPTLCPEMTEAGAKWICAGAYDPCATFCVAALRTCDVAKCALSSDSSCDNDLFDSCLYECLSVAQNRHSAS